MPATWPTPGAVCLTVVISDSDHAQWIRSLGDVDHGVAAITVRPGTRRVGWVAADLLAACGARRDVSGIGRDEDVDVAVATARLSAHRVTDILVTDVGTLPGPVLTRLLRIAAAAGARLWLIADTAVDAPTAHVLTQWPVTPVARDDFDTLWAGHLADRSPPASPPTGDELPDVPAADFPCFRAMARDLLDADDFARVDAVYRAAHTATVGWLADHDPTEESVAAWLHTRLAAAPTAAHMTTVVRAAQAAAFTAGWFVQVDLVRLLAAADAPLAAAAADPVTWRRLRAYSDPHRAAVCALLAAGMDVTTQARLTVGDAAADGSHVVLNGRRTDVHPDAAVFLRTLVARRRQLGAGNDDRLLTRRTGAPLSVRAAADVVTTAMRELGVALVSGQVLRNNPNALAWLVRRGVSIAPLHITDAQRAAGRTLNNRRTAA